MTAINTESCKTKTILLVEDEESHAEVVRRLFEEDSPDWLIHHVSNISDALKWLELNKESPPTLVISDYRLPDGNGLELAKNAQSPEEVGFPLIILTGVGSEKLAVQTIKSGAMDYIVKSGEELRQLPRIAVHVIREWDLITGTQSIRGRTKEFHK